MLIFARSLERHASRPLSSLRSVPDVDCRSVKATTEVAVCILKILSFKRHTCSHLFLTRLVICLYSSPSGDLWFLSRKKSKGKRMVYPYKVTLKLTWDRANNSSLYKPLSSKFHFFTDKEVMMKTMLL